MTWSSHNQYMVISKDRVYPIGDISFEDAALFNIATFPLAAIRKCRLEIGESAIVMGLGILGLCAIPLLKAAGAVPIIAVDPDPIKREKAIKCGADFAFSPFEADFSKVVKEVTNGGAKVGIEVTGIGAGLDGILDCMAQFGRVALLGCTRSSDFTIDYYRKVHGPGITLVGAHTDARPQSESSKGWWTAADDMDAIVKLHLMGRIKLSNLIDEVHYPEEATEIYNRLCSEKTFPIVQFDWSKIK
jgi:threonine dehydrogenase-like Zn-dependent dehydrogenase